MQLTDLKAWNQGTQTSSLVIHTSRKTKKMEHRLHSKNVSIFMTPMKELTRFFKVTVTLEKVFLISTVGNEDLSGISAINWHVTILGPILLDC